MAQQPPSKKSATLNRAQPKGDAATPKRSQEDSYFDEFFQSQVSHQLDTTPEPEQQRQWISDQLMWETTLGLREDDAINRVITPEGEPFQNAAGNTQHPAAPKKQLSDGDLQLLRTQVSDDAATSAPVANNNAMPSRQRPLQKQAPVPQQRAPGSVPPTRQRPPEKLAVPPSASQRHAGTRQPAQPAQTRPAQAPVRPGMPRQGTPSTTTASRAPVKQAVPKAGVNPATAPSRQTRQAATNPAMTNTRPVSPNRAASGNTRGAHQPAPDATMTKRPPPHTRTQPVIVKSGDETVLLLDTPIKSRYREKAWREGYFQWAKKIAAVVSIAITCFIGGYHYGGKHADEVQVADILQTLEKVKTETNASMQAQKSHGTPSIPAKSKHKTAPKPERTSASRPAVTDGDTMNRPSQDADRPVSAAVFEGKDIAVSPEGFENAEAGGSGATSNDFVGDENQTANGVKNSSPEGQSSNQSAAPAAATPETLAKHNTGNAVEKNSSPANSKVTTAENSTGQSNPPHNNANEIQELLKQSLQAFNNKQWQALVDLSNKILGLDPTVVNALTNRAAAYTELNLFGLALKDCNTVIKMDPKNPLAINNRGYVYEKMGDTQNAVTDYQTACNLGQPVSCKEATRLKQGLP